MSIKYNKLSGAAVQHSIGRSFAAWGCGYIAYNAAMAVHRAGRLSSVIAPDFTPSDIPDHLIHTVPGISNLAARMKIPYRVRVKLGLDFFLMDNAFDFKARSLVGEAQIFHGWSHQSLFSMKCAKRRGMKTVIERPNMHPLDQTRLVNEEYKKFGINRNSQCPGEITKTTRELSLADRIIVCSELAKDSHIANGVPADKISVIHYGADTEVFTPGDKKDNVFRVIYCGMVCLRKGPQYLLRAWKELALSDAELWLIGIVLPDAVKLMEEYGNLPGLRLVGHVNSRPELAELYRQGCVFVFPSVEDGFAMVVTEAMACGIPVIISDNTGARDLIEDGTNGYVVPTYDVDAIKDRILRIKQDSKRSNAMSAAARAVAEQNTWKHYSEKLLKVYDSLI